MKSPRTQEHFITLTEEGEETIHYFKNDISPAIQEDINSFLSNKQYELKNEVAIKLTIIEIPTWNIVSAVRYWNVILALIDLTLTVPTESEAMAIAANWTQKNEKDIRQSNGRNYYRYIPKKE